MESLAWSKRTSRTFLDRCVLYIERCRHQPRHQEDGEPGHADGGQHPKPSVDDTDNVDSEREEQADDPPGFTDTTHS